MNRRPARLLEVGDQIFIGPEKIRSLVVDIGKRCQSELVVPALRPHVIPKPLVEIFVKLSRRVTVEETGFRADFFTVFLDGDQIVRVIERDSQPATS